MVSKEIGIIKVVNKKKTFVNAKGKEVPSYVYCIAYNGQLIPFKPIYNDGYLKLDVLADVKFKE